MVKFSWNNFKELEEIKEMQFMSIKILDGTDVFKVINYIVDKYPNIENFYYDTDFDEILLEILFINDKRGGWGCSMSQLRDVANEIAVADIAEFSPVIHVKRMYWDKLKHDDKEVNRLWERKQKQSSVKAG